MTGIYKITSPTGRIYIGQSWDLINRQCSYRKLHCKQQPKIYESIKKHGWDQHRFEIICELPSDVTQEVLTQYETLYWDSYRSYGFDMMNVKEPGAYGKHSDETRKLMSIVHKNITDDTRRKMSESAMGKGKGVPKSEEHRKRIAEALRGKKKSEEHNRKNSEAQKGKKLSEETIRKRQETRKLRGHTIPESFKNNWKKSC
jgi:group I intron endonuclease